MSRRTNNRHAAMLLLLAALAASVSAQTPVIGGACKVGTADVQIGGKQTQFFLKCEATAESTNGEGVWVVKSRSAASSPSAAAPATTALPAENTQPQRQMFKYNPNICEQDNNAREGDSCGVSPTCLQANLDNPTTFLQCEQSSARWIKKSCQDTYIFNFEQQACIVPKRNPNTLHRQQTGLVCTYSSCSNSNPCSSGTCNNGYCCSSSGNTGTQIILAQPSTSSCNGCAQQAPQIITIPSCPGGSQSYGSCASTGFCATGYQCIQGSCCPSYSQPSVTVYTCPGGGSAVGTCINGGCATGYTCSSNNQCCPTTNPFVCSDGTQAAGGCVNGQCGTGYTCSNGLCCASTSSSPKCLDGSPAVGACIPSCQGNACGGSTLTYYCGSGYTCTTGNICCPTTSCPDGGEPIGPTVNGLCPTGYSAQGTQCCSIVATCLDGEENIGLPVNNLCPTGATLRGTACCLATTTLTFAATCTTTVQLGPCTSTQAAGDTCGGQLGYACRADADGVTDAIPLVCCPLVDYTNDAYIIGPAIGGSCPIDYTPVLIDNIQQCVALSSIPGLCAASSQSGPCISGDCPSGYTCNIYAEVCCSDTSLTMSRLKNHVVKPPRSIFSSRPHVAGKTVIGASCTASQQCVGFSDGLSKCERRVCRCTSIAYTKGIACVRKKMLLFNDEPVPVEASADTNSVVAPSS